MFLFFFFNDTATTEIYPLSLHDALPIWAPARVHRRARGAHCGADHARHVLEDHVVLRPLHAAAARQHDLGMKRSEEHTSELQSRSDLVCRLLLEKKKKNVRYRTHSHQSR